MKQTNVTSAICVENSTAHYCMCYITFVSLCPFPRFPFPSPIFVGSIVIPKYSFPFLLYTKQSREYRSKHINYRRRSVTNHFTRAGVGQNNGNTIDTVHISVLIWCWTTMRIEYSLNPFCNRLVQVLNSL
jgi:hypothetical protein